MRPVEVSFMTVNYMPHTVLVYTIQYSFLIRRSIVGRLIVSVHTTLSTGYMHSVELQTV